MGFSTKIKEDLMVASARHCSVCHKYKGVRLEIHHIIPKHKGGEDSAENGIVVCFDCHADAGHYNPEHPKGTKLSTGELFKHKEIWEANVKTNNIQIAREGIEVSFSIGVDGATEFSPIFSQEITRFESAEKFKKINIKEFIKLSSSSNNDMFTRSFLQKIKTTEDLISFVNGDYFGKYKSVDPNQEFSPQPVLFKYDGFQMASYSYQNLSTCVIRLQIKNNSSIVLENYKVYLKFNGVIKADAVDKRKEFLDSQNYTYNLTFKNEYEGEFIPLHPILVQDDFVEMDLICFKPEPQRRIVSIDWRIVAKDYSQNGQIELIINPIIEQQESKRYVEIPSEPILGEIKTKFKF